MNKNQESIQQTITSRSEYDRFKGAKRRNFGNGADGWDAAIEAFVTPLSTDPLVFRAEGWGGRNGSGWNYTPSDGPQVDFKQDEFRSYASCIVRRLWKSENEVLYLIDSTEYSGQTRRHQRVLVRYLDKIDGKYLEVPAPLLNEMIPVGELTPSGWHGSAFYQMEGRHLDVIEQIPDTWIHEKDENGDDDYTKPSRHIMGGGVFRVGNNYYIIALDRGSAISGEGVFLTQLPCRVESVTEAFEVLKPVGVREAEAQNRDVVRQGEWFFIPQTDAEIDTLKKANSFILVPHESMLDYYYISNTAHWSQEWPKNWRAHFLPNRGRDPREWHHFVNKMAFTVDENNEVKDIYVQGNVRHYSKEHFMLRLVKKVWYKVIESTHLRSVTGSGTGLDGMRVRVD